jgi:hypothetical protein
VSVKASPKGETFPIIWDSGAIICVTPSKDDFIKYSTKTDISEVKGLGGTASRVIGQGMVSWSVHDTCGSLRHLRLKAYHIPTSKSRLICTNVLLTSYPGEHLTVEPSSMLLSGMRAQPSRLPVLAINNPTTNLPTTMAYNQDQVIKPGVMLCNTVNTVNNHNINLTSAQKELLIWHQRLGHLDFKKILHLMRTGILSHTIATWQLHTAASKIKEMPKCAAFLFGKQTVCKSPGTTSQVVKDRAGVLQADNLLPGSKVSVDHFISSVKGCLFSGDNRGDSSTNFIGGCIFVNHCSGYIHIGYQSSLSSHDTLHSKL